MVLEWLSDYEPLFEINSSNDHIKYIIKSWGVIEYLLQLKVKPHKTHLAIDKRGLSLIPFQSVNKGCFRFNNGN